MHNRLKLLAAAALTGAAALTATAQRTHSLLRHDWEFTKGRPAADTRWQRVSVPHDWAIYGPFDRANDLQTVAVRQNGETRETCKTGRTGGLPFIGQGTYRRNFDVADTAGRRVLLVFDGAMSNARVKVNGHETAYWPYGYNSFYTDVTEAVRPGSNDLTVELENFERASRWYPGAGLYRNVHLLTTDRVHVPVWGTCVTTPDIRDGEATVRVVTEVEGARKGERVDVRTDIIDPQGRTVATRTNCLTAHGQPMIQNLVVPDPNLWSCETPQRYTARTTLSVDGREVDSYSTRFGIRRLEYLPQRGFLLNGKPTKFKGVCNHHDLGPLGAAVNRSALEHQVRLLKDMGANAIRTAHNMPAPELVDICDSLGMMMMVEPFDDWGYKPKSPNGYGRFFNEWARRDVTNMVRRYRNSPSIVMWSIGNEVPSQWSSEGIAELTMLQDLVHHLDPTRPVTCGMDQIRSVLDNGFAAALDIPGFNYKPQYYRQAYERLPQGLILGSETASTVSSRGVYHFPADFGKGDHNEVKHADGQSSSYDVEACPWSNTPDIDFLMDEEPWMLGQFVWTGFDYLGEPSPYDTDAWPNHSSVFGIIDLASLPKDRYWLYRSQWNKSSPTLHVLPHWTWPGREDKVTPVFVYTSYPKAELFINGRSQGVREFSDSTLYTRYRLMWPETVYEPGTLTVVAYNADGSEAERRELRTAGKPYRLTATLNRDSLRADGQQLAYITVQVEDRQGNIVPTATNAVRFQVTGAGSFEAAANGDPRSLRSFQQPEMDLFSGACTAIVRAADHPGTLTLRITSPGLKPATLTIPVMEVR